ncbi:capsular polysaccharide biosynthesis protein [Vogesella indigofera]|uniref:capsular polysaccharide biosynthesis protein n=1 Tax=Vogesella indigofera TaxID=45465 RepID=UPI0035AD95BB
MNNDSRHYEVTWRDYGLWRNRSLPLLLQSKIVIVWRGGANPQAIRIGWGQKPSGKRAQEDARRSGSKMCALEDGFVRSVGLGVAGHPPLSLVIDDLGIYYDAARPSRLDVLIRESVPDAQRLAAVQRAMALLRRYRLSKYNHAPDCKLPPPTRQGRVLVLDQTRGDVSVSAGGADQGTFAAMLVAACAENQDAEVWVKTHPDVLSGKKQGYLTVLPDSAQLKLLAEDVSPLSLLEQVDKVYVVTSQMGFEALLLGKPVVCFGQPWYAGWGLTDDRHPDRMRLATRREPRSLEALFSAAYFDYTRYLDPATDKAGTLFDVIDWLARNKAFNDELRGTVYCVGMSLWKRSVVTPFLKTPSNRLVFVRHAAQLSSRLSRQPGRVVVWGQGNQAVWQVAHEHGAPVSRIEDGFLRSVGLGSDLRAPLSLALDDSGIYYDPFSKSRLERLLAASELDEAAREQASRLRQRLAGLRLSKYNVGGGFALPAEAAGRRVLLVPGQVEDDASIRTGSPVVCRNADLLRTVRAANPDAWIVYKPHPDVVAGNRIGAVDAATLSRFADQVAAEACIADCIAAADELHTMTSLAGFEALLQDKVVHCYGGPFYAGWGLTHDHMPLPHRTRRLSLDELVHGVLCQYPRYRLPGVTGFCSVEHVVDHLAAAVRSNGQGAIGSYWLARQFRKLRELWRTLAGSAAS